MTPVSIYDMDKTITRRATYAAFLAHMARSIAPWRVLLLPLVGLVMLAYVLGRVDRGRVKELNQALMIGRRVSRARILPAVERFADAVVARNMRDGALAQIAADRAEGRLLVIASASYRLYVDAIGRRLGFDGIIATDHLGQETEWLQARIAGENCYDVAKLRMIGAWMAAHGLDRAACHIRAYSDHVTDAPMLEWADEAVATNPHPPLRKLAGERGWRVVDWV
jgi:HAD superfamily hydrolase (TIGR01490 family)